MAEEEKSTTELKNTVKIKNAGPCKKKVSIEIPEESILKQADEQYNTLRKDVVVPGFRRGHTPRRLLEKRFGKETSEQVKLKLLADASDSAIKDNELDVLSEPDIDFKKIELPQDGPLKFDFEVEVRPEFELPELKGIAIKKTKLEVTDEQIDREIEQFQKYSGTWTPCEKNGKTELDNQVIADTVVTIEGVEEKEKHNNLVIHVRTDGFVASIPVKKLDEVLVGAQIGDVKEVSVDIPSTYFREEYRGKKVEVQVKVKEIKRLKPAELNEALLEKLGIENEAELRENLRNNLHGKLEQQAQQEMAKQIYDYMLSNIKLDLPTDLVAEQAGNLLQRKHVDLLVQGLSREQVEEQMEKLQAQSEDQAKEQLKTFFIMDKVAEKLKVEISENEVNGQIAQAALQQNQRPERMKEQMVKDGSLTQFKLQVKEGKCIAKLLEMAEITEVASKKAKKTRKSEKKPKKAVSKKTVAKKSKKKSTDKK